MSQSFSKTEIQAITGALKKLLGSTYILYLKTQRFHWNVKGPHFSAFHAMFETQYTELAVAIDLIAERILALGENAPGSFAEFRELSVVKEATNDPSAVEMVKTLAKDHMAVVKLLRESLEVASADEASEDVLIGRIQEHEKTAWMLNSHAE